MTSEERRFLAFLACCAVLSSGAIALSAWIITDALRSADLFRWK